MSPKNPPKKIYLPKATFDSLVEKAVAQTTKQLIHDKKIRLDSVQMGALAEKVSEHVKIEIDYPRLENAVLDRIPKPKDGKDLVLNDLMRADFTEQAAMLIPKPKDGQDGKAGADYKFTRQDRADIAEEILSGLSLSEEDKAAIVKAVMDQPEFLKRSEFRQMIGGLMKFVEKNKGKVINAGISGRDMIDDITAILGTDWQTGGGGGAGDMLKADYDANDDGKVDVGAFDDSELVKLTGNQSVAGEKTFSDKLTAGDLEIDGDSISNGQADGHVKIIPNGVGGIGNEADLTDKFLGFKRVGNEVVDQSFTSAASTPGGVADGQIFTAGVTGYLSSISVKVSGAKPSTTFTLYKGIFEEILIQKVLNLGDGVNNIPFDPVYIKAGQKYTIYMAAGAGNMGWLYNPANGYANGRSTTNPAWDHYFITYTLDKYLVLRAFQNTNRIGINVETPDETLHVGGNIKAVDGIFQGVISGSGGILDNSAATVIWDMDKIQNAELTLTQNIILIPVNAKATTKYNLSIISTGASVTPYTITWNSLFKWTGGIFPILTAPNSSTVYDEAEFKTNIANNRISGRRWGADVR